MMEAAMINGPMKSVSFMTFSYAMQYFEENIFSGLKALSRKGLIASSVEHCFNAKS